VTGETECGVRLLVGDIGGTNARLAIVEVTGPAGRAGDRAGTATGSTTRFVRQRTLPSRSYGSLVDAVRAFGVDADLAGACFAIAGPIVGHDVHASNLPWTVHGATLAAAIGVPRARLINDFDAVGRGLPLLAPDAIATLQAGVPVDGGVIALIGAGTGLGHAILVDPGGRSRVLPSEGGHATLAARTEVEWRLVRYLARRYGGHVSYERAISGPGLVDLHQFVLADGIAVSGPTIEADLAAEDPAAVISKHALDGSDPACVAALDLFVGLFAAQAGNFALTTLATGGVYLAGGIAARILPLLETGRFLDAFTAKGRMSALLRTVPVHVILDDRVGLLGAAAAAVADQSGDRPATYPV